MKDGEMGLVFHTRASGMADVKCGACVIQAARVSSLVELSLWRQLELGS